MYASTLIPNLPANLASLDLTDEQAHVISRLHEISAMHPASRPSCILRARAGASKTTMLCLIASLIPPAHAFHEPPIFLAFNKAIAEELSTRLPSSCRASTFHSLGYNVLRRMFKTKTDMRKYQNILEELVGDFPYEQRANVLRVIERLRNAAIPLDEITAAVPSIIEELDLLDEDLPDVSPSDYHQILLMGASRKDTCDFTDMLWLPFIHGLRSRASNFILVDESQDTNKLQVALLSLFGGPETCYIFVGDDRQAIYGFRGALSNAMTRIADTFHIDSDNILPLSTTFRCAQAICAEAQQLVPDLRAKPSAPIGHVITCTSPLLDFPPDTLIVCRNNAPIARVAMQLLRARESFCVLSDFFPRLAKFAEARVKSKRDSIETFVAKLLLWQEEKLSSLPESRHEGILERTTTLRELCEELGPDKTVEDLLALLARICNSTGSVRLATIHKSKGLEATNVFFLNPELLPSKYAITPEAKTQEANLRYVAITRAKHLLVYWSPRKGEEVESARSLIQ